MTHTTQSVHDVRTSSGLVPGALWWAQAQHGADGIGRDSTIEVEHYLVWNRHCPAEILTILAQHPDFNIRAGVAGNPNTPLGVLQQLRSDPAVEVRGRLAQRTDLDDDTYLLLSRDPHGDILEEICNNPSIPVDLLIGLYQQNVQRGRLAGNPACPDNLLAHAATSQLRRQVAGNPSTPLAVLEKLCSLHDAGVDSCLIVNSHVSGDMLRALYRDTDPLRHTRIIGNPACPADLAMEWYRNEFAETGRGELGYIVANPALPKEILLSAWQVDDYVRAAIAVLPWCPEHLLALCPTHRDTEVRAAAAKNPTLSVTALEQYGRDRANYVRQAAWRSPRATAQMLRSAPLRELARSTVSMGHQLPDLENDFALRVVALATNWSGTIDELFYSIQLLDA